MNIFHVDVTGDACAMAQCDSHVVKMPVETAQMCSTAMHMRGVDTDEVPGLYKPCYEYHPMNVWVRETDENLWWTIRHGLDLCRECNYRYGKIHSSPAVLRTCFYYMLDYYNDAPNTMHYSTEPPQCMPDEFKHVDHIEAYREFYRVDKAHIHRWTRRQPPSWLHQITTTQKGSTNAYTTTSQ